MDRLQILDCTLRDGGYCNGWDFGNESIRRILAGLEASGADIVECGFLTDRVGYRTGNTRFPDIRRIEELLPADRGRQKYVCMVNYGEYQAGGIPDRRPEGLDGIRVAFHKKDRAEAMAFCGELCRKGYLVFIQAMVSLNYTDSEFLDLIERANRIRPYAFYIVDSFGVMKRRDMERFFWLTDHNLDRDILLGFHSHNNMQLAYSNAQAFAEMRTGRERIVDTSIMGMGRGAGNLNTELFVEYLNESAERKYELKPLLTVIDETLSGFYRKAPWGYSLSNYLSASHNAHPNYAGYLASKHTLTVSAMDEIFSMMPSEKKKSFDREYIEELYISYQSSAEGLDEHRAEIMSDLGGRALLVAPGKSSKDEKERILEYIRRTGIKVISINHDYPYFDPDYIFVSNSRRFRELDAARHGKCIVTSNINAEDVYSRTSYGALLNDTEPVRDNGGLMALKYLIGMGVKEVLLAGMDGYTYRPELNYAQEKMAYSEEKAVFDSMNDGMRKVLGQYAGQTVIRFLTEPRMINIERGAEIWKEET